MDNANEYNKKTDLKDDLQLEKSQHTDLEGNQDRRHSVGKLELLEERAVLDKERLDIGKVKISKKVVSRMVDVPIELSEEVLVIETEYYDADSQLILSRDVNEEDIITYAEPTLNVKPSIKVNGSEVFLEDDPVEIVMSRQMAVIKKETYAVQDINIEKSTHLHKDSIEVQLKHEELDVLEEGFLEHEQTDDNDIN